MPLVSSPRPVPIWISGSNNRTRMNKFHRCKHLNSHTKRVDRIKKTPTDRIDNQDQIHHINFSRKCHKSARDAAQRYQAQMDQRSNLIVFLNLQDARYGKHHHINPVAEREKLMAQVHKFKTMRRQRSEKAKKKRIDNEKRVLRKRIKSIKPSPCLDRKRLAAEFKDAKTVKKGLLAGKARLRVDSFQIMEQMEKSQTKRMKEYHQMAMKRKTARKKRKSKSRRRTKPELPTWRWKNKTKKKKQPLRPKSARVGLNQSNRDALRSATKKEIELQSARDRLSIPVSTDELGGLGRQTIESTLTARSSTSKGSKTSGRSGTMSRRSFRPSRIQLRSQYVDYGETVDAHEDIIETCPKNRIPRRSRRPSVSSIHSSPHFAIESMINRALFTHIMENDDQSKSITEYLSPR